MDHLTLSVHLHNPDDYLHGMMTAARLMAASKKLEPKGNQREFATLLAFLCQSKRDGLSKQAAMGLVETAWDLLNVKSRPSGGRPPPREAIPDATDPKAWGEGDHELVLPDCMVPAPSPADRLGAREGAW